MDQGREKRIDYVGCIGRCVLRLHGIGVGRIRLHYQLDSVARVCSHLHGPIQLPPIH